MQQVAWWIWLIIGAIVGFVFCNGFLTEYSKTLTQDNIRLQRMIDSLVAELRVYKNESMRKHMDSKVKRLDPFGLNTHNETDSGN